MRRQLMDELPDFGRYLGYDGKAVKSHSTGRVNKATGKTSDPDADWGKHQTCGVDKNGRAWNKIKKWFGYRWHMISDTQYEIPDAMTITAASCGEGKQLRRILRQLMDEDPQLAQRAQSSSPLIVAWITSRPKPCCGTTIRFARSLTAQVMAGGKEGWRLRPRQNDHAPAQWRPVRGQYSV